MNNEKRIKKLAVSSLVLSVICLTIAFLAMSKVVKINNNNNISDARWSVHFDNLKSKAYGDAKIIKYPVLKENNTYIGDFEISLTKPKDKVVFMYDVVNDGTLKAKYDITYVNGIIYKSSNESQIINSIFKSADINGDGITSEEEIKKASQLITIKDKVFKGTLNKNEVQKGSLTISFEGDEVIKGDVTLNINLKYNYVQK